MSVSVEKSGSKVKIPPDDWIKPERSKRRHERKRSSKSSSNPSKYRESKNSDKNSLKPKRELSAKEKNRKRVEEQRAIRERKHISEHVKRAGSLRQSDMINDRGNSSQIRYVFSLKSHIFLKKSFKKIF